MRLTASEFFPTTPDLKLLGTGRVHVLIDETAEKLAIKAAVERACDTPRERAQKYGPKARLRMLSMDQARAIRNLSGQGLKPTVIASRFGVKHSVVMAILKNQTYREEA